MKKNKKALVFYGGWGGHEPELVGKRFASILEENGFEVEVSDTLDCLSDLDKLMELDVIVPCWTSGEIDNDYVTNISKAVASGVGLAGAHGGMCDSFRNNTQWQFITGGQWVVHPGGDNIDYTVNINRSSSPIIEGIEDFQVSTEHYYLHVDPAIEVLATTRFPLVPYYHSANKPVDMPVVWTKSWGNGRVFYSSLGHKDDIFDKFPTAQTLMERGMLWSAEGKQYAEDNELSTERFENDAIMF